MQKERRLDQILHTIWSARRWRTRGWFGKSVEQNSECVQLLFIDWNRKYQVQNVLLLQRI